MSSLLRRFATSFVTIMTGIVQRPPTRFIVAIIEELRQVARATSTGDLGPKVTERSMETEQTRVADAATDTREGEIQEKRRAQTRRLKSAVALLICLLVLAIAILGIITLTVESGIPIVPPEENTTQSDDLPSSTTGDGLVPTPYDLRSSTTGDGLVPSPYATSPTSRTTPSSTATTSGPMTSTASTTAPPPKHDFIMCSVLTDLKDWIPAQCDILFVVVRATTTGITYAGGRAKGFNKLIRSLRASNRTQLGMDFSFSRITQSSTNLAKQNAMDAMYKVGATLSGVLAAEIDADWSSTDRAIVNVLKLTRIVEDEGPAIGLTLRDGCNIRDARVIENLIRLLRHVRPSFIVYGTSLVPTRSKSCTVRAPSPWEGPAPSFKTAFELIDATPSTIRAIKLLTLTPALISYNLAHGGDSIGSKCKKMSFHGYNQWCHVPSSEIQHEGTIAFQRQWATVTLITVDDLDTLKTKICMANARIHGYWAVTHIELAEGYCGATNSTFVDTVREITATCATT
ncbi:uncharacterized protein LOC135375397 [Ornithodoros turicata]|uniref:uncharacterized protein LOC135375397 n=1 Tax=Ornithodoros turicata TaxID=34597 RepID=UPI003138C386